MATWTETLQDWVTTLQAPLAIPSILVRGAQGAASTVTGKPAPQIPQSVINAASGQTATQQDVINALPQLPDIQLPDFSLTNVFGDQTASLGKYVLWGGIALVAGYALMKPSGAR